MAYAGGIRAGAAFIELYARDMLLARGLKRAQARLTAFGASVRAAGLKMVGLSAAFATPFVAGVKVYADFEQQMANVSTMLEQPEKFMDKFRQGIRDMAIEFGESTDTLAGGLYDILSASVAPEKALQVLAVAAKAAKAGLSDTKTAADAITTVLNSYGLSADYAATVSDLLFKVVMRGKTTFAQLAPSIGNVATIAATAGVSLEEVGAALATMTRSGVQTENAVTALNAIISSFLKPTAEAEEYAKELGFEMSSTTLKTEGLAGVFKRISQLPPDAISKLFPNVRALKGVLPALKNMEGFTQDMAVMADRAGATEVAYGKMTKTMAHSFAQLKQSALVSLSIIGEALAEPLEKLAGTLKRWGGMIRDFLAGHKELVVAAAKVVGIVALVGAALITLGVAASALGYIFGGIGTILSLVGTLLSFIGSVLGALLTPIGLVVAALAGLGAYFLWASGAGGKALAWLSERFDDLKGFALESIQGIKDALAAGDIALAAKVLWLSLKVAWQTGINWLKGYWIAFKYWFLNTAGEAFDGLTIVVAEAWYGIRKIWATSINFLLNLWTNLSTAIIKVWNQATGWIAKQMAKVVGAFDESFDVEAVSKNIDEETKRLNVEADLRSASTQDARDKELAAIEEERKAVIGMILDESVAKDKERQESHDKELAESEEALRKAREEWKASLAEAKAKREAAEQKQPEAPEAPAAPEIPKIKEALQAALPAIEKAVKIEAVGTFSAEAAWGLGVGPSAAEDRTAKATEETAKNTKKIADRMLENEMVFE